MVGALPLVMDTMIFTSDHIVEIASVGRLVPDPGKTKPLTQHMEPLIGPTSCRRSPVRKPSQVDQTRIGVGAEHQLSKPQALFRDII